MCLDKDLARLASNYVKAQLSALYQNAVDCLKAHGETPNVEFKYMYALRKFDTDIPKLNAMFGQPRIEFVCNHDVIFVLTLEVTEPTVRQAGAADSGGPTPLKVSEPNQNVKEVALTFRVPFTTTSPKLDMLNPDKDKSPPVQLVILDFDRSVLVKGHTPEGNTTQDIWALACYLKEIYLPYLASVGNNVFLSIPCPIKVDYSIMGGPGVQPDEMYDITTDEFNKFLLSAWLPQAYPEIGDNLATFRFLAQCHVPLNRSSTGTAKGTFHFRLRMSPPRLQPLCEEEAVLYLNVDKVSLYDNTKPKRPLKEYTNWQVPIMIKIDCCKKADGHVTQCTLDSELSFASARHAPVYCEPERGFTAEDEETKHHWNLIIKFLLSTYLENLGKANLHVVYYHDSRLPGIIPQLPPTGIITQPPPTIDTIYNPVMVTSQSGLNRDLEYLWHNHQVPILEKWVHDLKMPKDFRGVRFEANFEPLTVRLLSSGHAIIWIHLKTGRYTNYSLPQPEGQQPSSLDVKESSLGCNGWSLAFEVPLGQKTMELPVSDNSTSSVPAWVQLFKRSHVYKMHISSNQHDSSSSFAFVFLDLMNTDAKFLYQYSSFGDLLHCKNPSEGKYKHMASRIDTVVKHLKKHYFGELVESGIDILQTIPLYKPGIEPLPVDDGSLTSIVFRVCAVGGIITRENWLDFSDTDPNITTFGMTDTTPRRISGSHVPGSGEARRTVVRLKREWFLDRYILEVLNEINARLTLIPLFNGFVHNKPSLELSTWEENSWTKEQKCDWEDEYDNETGKMEYIWKHRDSWFTTGRGKDCPDYTVSFEVCNTVELPVNMKAKCINIEVSGKTIVAFQPGESTHWHRNQRAELQSEASWKTTISIHTSPKGLSIQGQTKVPVAYEPLPTGSQDFSMLLLDTDIKSKLEARIPQNIDFTDVLNKLKQFEGPWKRSCTGIGLIICSLAHPVFDRAGNVNFELCPQSQDMTGTPTDDMPNGFGDLTNGSSGQVPSQHTDIPLDNTEAGINNASAGSGDEREAGDIRVADRQMPGGGGATQVADAV